MGADVRAPEFPAGLNWINVDKCLRFSHELKGHVVVLDFWTYCCINCQHVLAELAAIDRKYLGRPVVVIGVHSAKFENETHPDHIAAAIKRHRIAHPVVIDQDMRIWSEYGIRAWPTIVLIGPDGKIVGGVSGEGHRDLLEKTIDRLLQTAAQQGLLAAHPLPLAAPQLPLPPTGPLAFPGKVLADEKARRLFIADTNHDRIVIATLPDHQGKAQLLEVIGTGIPGRADGPLEEAQLHRPQGIALSGDTLWVADTDNHLVRAVDLKQRRVRTVLGTGRQVFDPEAGKTGPDQGLNSPWDVAVDGNRLYIAMAGQHQIFAMNLLTRMAEILAGTGREDLRDDDAKEANLAQPSGLAMDAARKRLYFADSEISAVRYVDLKSMRVETIIGNGLFEFGDVDGDFHHARLQHCLGVAVWGEKLLVADTYNHKVKIVDPEKRTVTTWAGGTGTLRLYEPASVAAGGGQVFVADTNNHRIVAIDPDTGAWREVEVEGLTRPDGCDNGVCEP